MSNKEHEKLAQEAARQIYMNWNRTGLQDGERIILAAIEKAVQQYDSEVSGHVVGMIDRLHKASQPQRTWSEFESIAALAATGAATSEPQPWTVKTVQELGVPWSLSVCMEIAAAHNAALGVEREKYMSARRSSDMGWERADKYAKALEWLRSVIRHNVDGKTVQLWLDGIDSTLAKAKEHK